MTEERQFAINACKELETTLSNYGFKTYENGLRYKRVLNKDITQEISFDVDKYFKIKCFVAVYSKKIMAWNTDNYDTNDNTLFGNQLGYITPLQEWKNWQIMKSDISKKQFHKEIIFQIKEYIIPLFNRFENMDLLIKDVINSGGKWSGYETSSNPNFRISSILAYGTIEDGEQLLNNYLAEHPQFIDQAKKGGWSAEVQQFKIAFDQGLKINVQPHQLLINTNK